MDVDEAHVAGVAGLAARFMLCSSQAPGEGARRRIAWTTSNAC
jgi:hypothetical protein